MSKGLVNKLKGKSCRQQETIYEKIFVFSFSDTNNNNNNNYNLYKIIFQTFF